MRLFVDSNVFVAAITDETETGEVASRLLNADHDFATSLLNLMEVRTVLTKKERLAPDRADDIQDEITSGVDVVIHDASDMLEANRIQQETLLYPPDAMILAAAQAQDATLVSFDSELLEHGATHPDDIV